MNKVKYLEGLRGVASLLVVFNHFIVAFYPAAYFMNKEQIHTKNGIEMLIGQTPFNILFTGNLSVCIFFVLSGYVLSYYYFLNGNLNVITSNAYRRYFRLLSPVFISSLISFIFIKLSLFFNLEASRLTFSGAWLGELWKTDASLISFFKTTLYDVFINGDSTYNTVLWTMSWEFKGSFLIFAVVAIFGRSNYRWLVYPIVMILTFNSYYLVFIAGMVLADYKASDFKIKNILSNPFLNGILILIGLYLGSYPMNYRGSIYSLISDLSWADPVRFHMIGATILLFLIINLQVFQNFFANRFFVYLGRISFSMYLLHVIVIGSFSCYLFMKMYPYFSYSTSVIITFAISMLLIFIISHLFSIFVDEPSVRVLKKMNVKFHKM
ncbi:acyltransferase [Paenibacillus polymyxa]|uniref:acyltransferase family protein n=1 Tax=Paenibacillus polymyxa TaxID=1406 RepID=UPI002AB4EC33|nr:acyltransferase [Paenibacillus polymyxa]MDY7989747.1 acyltransferase [Paenibacillus polymyxa]MDY8116408.1 acyltransferase [Paenibacillus polymyxa]